MGSSRQKKGDGHIIFHVGKELPERGDNILLVPGTQKAQGRGVYFSDEPRLKYSGSESHKKEMDITPVFCVPMVGNWIKSKKRMGSNKGEISYNSNQRLIALYDIGYYDDLVEEKKVRYYYPKKLEFFKEPDTEYKGRHITSEFSDIILKNKLSFEEAIRQLKEKHGSEEIHVDEEYILEKISEAMSEGRLPENKKIQERYLELKMAKEGPERESLIA